MIKVATKMNKFATIVFEGVFFIYLTKVARKKEVGTDEEDVGDEGMDEEEAEPAAQHTRFGPRWANFVRNLIE